MTVEVLRKKPRLDQQRKLNKYLPSHCETVQKMAQAGYSLRAFCAYINITYNTCLLWMREYEEFHDAVKVAEMKRHLFYEKTAIENLHSKNFNSILFNKLTAAVLKWEQAPVTEIHIDNHMPETKPPSLMSANERMERIKTLQEQLKLNAAPGS